MNENIPAAFETSVIRSVGSDSQSANSNDIIDLTEINDCDEYGESSSNSDIVSNNSTCPNQPRRPARSRRQINTNSSENNPTNARSESKDDSICILYENVQPPPDVVFVNEVIIDGRELNQSTDVDSISIPLPPVDPVPAVPPVDPVQEVNPVQAVPPVRPLRAIPRVHHLPAMPPVMMGSFTIDPVVEVPPLFSEISSEGTISPYQLSNYSMDETIAAHQLSSLRSCQYAPVINETHNGVPQSIGLQRSPLSTTQVPLNLTTVPLNPSSHGSGLEKLNIMSKVPKIQCGICLDGPDEIAATNRNFTSTNCGHVFCNDCIKTSMRTAAKCPKCRKKITSRSIHPLYL